MSREDFAFVFSVTFAALLAGLIFGLLVSCGGERPNRWPCDGGPELTCKQVYIVCSADARNASSWFSYIELQLMCDDGYKICRDSYDAGEP